MQNYNMINANYEQVTTRKEMTLLIEKLNPESTYDRQLVEDDLLVFMTSVFRKYYPGFDDWYRKKVISGFQCGERFIYIVKQRGSISGVSILKFSKNPQKSNKICSFYVSVQARSERAGQQLMIQSLKEFSVSYRPIVITVPEERVTEKFGKSSFLRFLRSFGFEEVAVIDGRYRPVKKEYVLLKP